eukprot:scaffold129579_cov39-Tisochrysis_lutea.AAC.1
MLSCFDSASGGGGAATHAATPIARGTSGASAARGLPSPSSPGSGEGFYLDHARATPFPFRCERSNGE